MYIAMSRVNLPLVDDLAVLPPKGGGTAPYFYCVHAAQDSSNIFELQGAQSPSFLILGENVLSVDLH